MDKQTVTCAHKRILLSNKKEQTIDTHNNTIEAQNNYTE